jgi:DNA-binding NarL/FixJ family response regulator
VQDVTVLVVDDHRAFGEALAARLDLEPDLRVVGAVATARDALRLAAELAPDVVTVDIDLGADGDGDGVDLSSQLAALASSPQVVVVSCVDDVQRAVAAVSTGSVCWVAKDAPSEELVAAVRAAVRGDGHMEPRLLGGVLRALVQRRRAEDAAASVLGRLTARELDVLELMAQGRDRSAIAAELFLTTNTVRTHVQNILGKLGAHTSLEAVAIARRCGLGQDGPPVPSPRRRQVPAGAGAATESTGGSPWSWTS